MTAYISLVLPPLLYPEKRKHLAVEVLQIKIFLTKRTANTRQKPSIAAFIQWSFVRNPTKSSWPP